MAEEVAAHYERERRRPTQTWNGSESALQLLCLPSKDVLPRYDDHPAYLSPHHCRLCLQPVNDSNLPDHLSSQHNGMTLEQYRHHVLRSSLTSWPEPIPSQLLRCRLAAFKEQLCDANYGLRSCSCCAREMRTCELRRVNLPSSCESTAPKWLELTDEEWDMYKSTWYETLDELFSIDRYIEDVFLADVHIQAAAKTVESFRKGEPSTAESSMEIAEAWLDRLQIWKANLHRDLVQDSTPSPVNNAHRWLLCNVEFEETSTKGGGVSLNLWLCAECFADLSAKGADGVPKPRMPRLARANGLWGGPEPEELACLTYAERKVIQLARLYVSVKRVFLDGKNYARPGLNETPKYHERNVVAYPQHLDVVRKIIGVLPEQLAETLTVQFVGTDRAGLQRQPVLQVSVTRLRRAFCWLAYNSWPWMQATKEELVLHDRELGGALQLFISN